jgi:hypothetical protein
MNLLYWLIMKNLPVTLFRGNFDHETRLQEPACSPELSNRLSFSILSLVGAQPGVVQMVLLATSKIKTRKKKNMKSRVQRCRHQCFHYIDYFLCIVQCTAEYEYKTDYYSVLQIMFISSLLGDNFWKDFLTTIFFSSMAFNFVYQNTFCWTGIIDGQSPSTKPS